MTLAYAVLCAEPDAGTRGRPSAPITELGASGERDLIARLRESDVTAFETIYRVFHPRLLAIATGYVRSAAIAEELAQDTLLMVWDRRAQWRDEDGLVIYLYATVRNRALKHLRHEGIAGRVGVDALAQGMNLGGAEPARNIDEVVERADLVDAVTRALHRLPEMQRSAFELRWIHQLSYDDVARIMGISAVSARQHVARARATLIPIALRWTGGSTG
jgi:RNA polymerase sigma-70 factor (ECF subfamily)